MISQASQSGTRVVAYVDEVGRGPLAGPVVACAVVADEKKILVTNKKLEKVLLGDSKKLSKKQREKLYEVLTRIPYIRWATASVGPKIIDRVNIFEATKRAACRAITKLAVNPDLIIIDGNMILPLSFSQKAIPKADEKFLACSIASIIAKVTRDRAMMRLDKIYPQYRFDKHKGYGTELHYAMLRKHGPSAIHRRSFRLS